MKPWARRLWRYLGRAAAVLAGLLALIGLSVALLLGTAFGRARLLGVALEQANAHIPGRLRVAALDRASPFGVALRGVELDDPAQTTVVTNHPGNLTPPPASALNKTYPVCTSRLQDDCQNPGEGGAPGRSRALGYWPGEPASERDTDQGG